MPKVPFEDVYEAIEATEELLAQMFQNTWIGAALRWFLNLEGTKARS